MAKRANPLFGHGQDAHEVLACMQTANGPVTAYDLACELRLVRRRRVGPQAVYGALGKLMALNVVVGTESVRQFKLFPVAGKRGRSAWDDRSLAFRAG